MEGHRSQSEDTLRGQEGPAYAPIIAGVLQFNPDDRGMADSHITRREEEPQSKSRGDFGGSSNTNRMIMPEELGESLPPPKVPEEAKSGEAQEQDGRDPRERAQTFPVGKLQSKIGINDSPKWDLAVENGIYHSEMGNSSSPEWN